MILRVRRLEAVDLPTRVQWLGNPSIYTQMTIDVPISLDDTRAWFSRNSLNERRKDFTFLKVGDCQDEPLIVAMGGLVDVDSFHRRAELYIMVDPALTGKGIGRRVLHWLCNYGFIQLNLVRIYLYTTEANVRARRFYEHNGFRHEGILRKHLFHNGRWCDRYIQSLLREEWETQPWRVSPPIQLEMDF